MSQPEPDAEAEAEASARDHLARNWRSILRQRRLQAAGVIAVVLAGAWIWDAMRPGGGMFSLAYWPLLMPLVLIFGAMLVTGRQQRHVGHVSPDFRTIGFLAGDHSVVEGYPPVVQAGLLRAARAGASHETLLPLPHRLLWRLGLPVPPVAFGPTWFDALFLFATMYVFGPLWLQVQFWWNPGTTGDTLRLAGGTLTFLSAIFALLIAAYRASQRQRLWLPTWREFRRSWEQDQGA